MPERMIRPAQEQELPSPGPYYAASVSYPGELGETPRIVRPCSAVQPPRSRRSGRAGGGRPPNPSSKEKLTHARAVLEAPAPKTPFHSPRGASAAFLARRTRTSPRCPGIGTTAYQDGRRSRRAFRPWPVTSAACGGSARQRPRELLPHPGRTVAGQGSPPAAPLARARSPAVGITGVNVRSTISFTITWRRMVDKGISAHLLGCPVRRAADDTDHTLRATDRISAPSPPARTLRAPASAIVRIWRIHIHRARGSRGARRNIRCPSLYI